MLLIILRLTLHRCPRLVINRPQPRQYPRHPQYLIRPWHGGVRVAHESQYMQTRTLRLLYSSGGTLQRVSDGVQS